jgi:hypothetical protein
MDDQLSVGKLPSKPRQERPKVLVDGRVVGRVVMLPNLRMKTNRGRALCQGSHEFLVDPLVHAGLHAPLP